MIRTNRGNIRSQQEVERHQQAVGYYENYGRSVYGDLPTSRRIKRLDQDSDCDNEVFSNLIIGCNSVDTMEFRSDCFTPDLISCKLRGHFSHLKCQFWRGKGYFDTGLYLTLMFISFPIEWEFHERYFFFGCTRCCLNFSRLYICI